MSLTNSMLVVDGNAVGGDTEDLTAYQTKQDNSLNTTSKQVVGAINEINSNLSSIGTVVNNILNPTEQDEFEGKYAIQDEYKQESYLNTKNI